MLIGNTLRNTYIVLESCLDEHSVSRVAGHKLAPLVGIAIRLIVLEEILHDFIILVAA